MAGTLPTISIVVPSLNQAAFIEQTLQSVFAQDYPATELIVIDGGSTDGTQAIIEKHLDRIHYFISEPDSGQSDAINKGMRQATGELMTWLCSDDLLLPGALREVAEAYSKHPDAGLFHAGGTVFGDGIKEKKIGIGIEDRPLSYIAGIPFPQPSSFFTRKAFDLCGPLDLSLNYGMDYGLFQSIALNFDVIACDSIWSAYRMHKDSKTSSQLGRFVGDWARVFSRFLNSLPDADEFKKALEKENLWFRNEPIIRHERIFSQSDRRTIVFLFILDQFRVQFELLEKETCLRLLQLMKSVDLHLFEKHGLGQLEFRLRFLPASLYRFVRRLKR
ncbi:MAG: hypothetical protein RL021_2142 [Bacteroidota bacterium]|jgi:glycosyltransferase involved in cell wall biosynthesis